MYFHVQGGAYFVVALDAMWLHVVIEMVAYNHGCLFSMGALSPDFTNWLWCACTFLKI